MAVLLLSCCGIEVIKCYHILYCEHVICDTYLQRHCKDLGFQIEVILVRYILTSSKVHYNIL